MYCIISTNILVVSSQVIILIWNIQNYLWTNSVSKGISDDQVGCRSSVGMVKLFEDHKIMMIIHFNQQTVTCYSI